MTGADAGRGEGRVRPSAYDIYENVKHDAAEELKRNTSALAFSGLFAGATIGFGGLASAAVAGSLGSSLGARLAGALVYPLGFVAAIVGRAQLFTENTLYPMTLVLDERRHLRAMAKLWLVVFATNILGTLAFAFLVVDSGGVPGQVVRELVHIGHQHSLGSFQTWLFSGVLAGWLLALVAWLIEASSAVIGQILLIWGLTFIIGIAGLDHCVSTTVEVLAAVVGGHASIGHFFAWLGSVTLGNLIGGIFIVALLNYGQVRSGADDQPAG